MLATRVCKKIFLIKAIKIFCTECPKGAVYVYPISPPIYILTYCLTKFSFQKKALKYDHFPKWLTKIFIFEYFLTKSFRNELHTPFLPYFDTSYVKFSFVFRGSHYFK